MHNPSIPPSSPSSPSSERDPVSGTLREAPGILHKSAEGLGGASARASAVEWLVGGGEMGKLVGAMDWGKTPLGPIESWPQSLRTTVSLGLASNFPISLIWGPGHVQIYNDGYWPICGGKHPEAMGQDFSECWASAWPVIGEAFERALEGETSYLENQRMFLDRNGYLEETFFTFSFSPIRDETGGVGGLFHPVTETTAKMVGERQIRMLRDVTARIAPAQTSDEAFALATQTMAEFNLDLPFAMFYLLDAGGEEARLSTTTCVLPEAVAPALIDLRASAPLLWPIGEVARTKRAVLVHGLEKRCGAFSCGVYPETPQMALALPITPPGCERPLAILIAGVSSRLPLNDAYRASYDLLAAAVTAAVANARAYEQERKRAEALAEIDRAKTAFFSNVSHEFRTPLTLMLGPLEDELAEQSDLLPPFRRERLEMAHRNSLRLLKLVNTLLDFSRIEAGRLHASYEPIDLAEYTAELASVFRSAVEKGGLALTVDCPPLPEPVYVDREMWEKVVLNLLSNAFKHTFTGGIQVVLRWGGDHCELTVVDSGVGIPPAELPHLFDRFHRVKGAKSRTHEGTGIGLSLVQELVRAHGGIVRVESREGRGSTFAVTIRAGNAHLPADKIRKSGTRVSTATGAAAYVEEALHWISEAPAELAPLADRLVLKPADAPTDSARPRILWADDNADMREYVGRLLGGFYEVTAVCDGAAALASALAAPPDLVLTDVMMPGLDGFGLLRALRAEARTRTIPVILLSARAGEESTVEGLEAGADVYLAKPFSARELLTRVRSHLDLAQSRREWALELERRVQERTEELAQTNKALQENGALLRTVTAELRQLNAELETRVTQRTSELEAANKELEAFSYSVSHDLRAPLRAVDGFSQAVLEDFGAQLPAEGLRYLKTIRQGAQRMGRLIDDLLTFSRLGRALLHEENVNTGELVRGVLADLEAQRQGRQIDLRFGELPESAGDPALLRQVWTNLLSNAFKYTQKRVAAVVEIGCEPAAAGSIFYVRDNGTGFDMRYAGKLFGVFQRLHRAEDYEGTGVGLAIVQRIIQRHGGRIWAEAAVDRGATFYFTLQEQPSL